MHLIRATDSEFEKGWKQLRANGKHLDALYGSANLAYYREYCGNPDAQDFSFIIVDGLNPVCGVRAFRIGFAGSVEISCLGLPIVYLEHPNLRGKDHDRIRRILRDEIGNWINGLSVRATIQYKESLTNGRLSLFGRILLDLGAEATPSFSQIIDLSASEEDLHKGLTKAYKWSVNWGKKNLTLSVADHNLITLELIEKFRLLHIKSAGRETRSPESWRLQYEMILSGEAFCVFGLMDGVLVSAALFPYSQSHCFYGVSASCRDCFDKPLGHALVWSAILFAKKRGIRYLEMGEQLFPVAPRHNPSQKELGISFFKRSFGGVSRVFLDISLKKPAEKNSV